MDVLDQFVGSSSQVEELAFEEVEHPAPSHPATGNSGNHKVKYIDVSPELAYDTEATKQDLQTIGIPWNVQVQNIERTIKPAAPTERPKSIPGIPPYYLEVLEVGLGVSGTVALCLPRSEAIAALYRQLQGEPPSIAKLKSKLVAVKAMVSKRRGRHEINITQIVMRNVRSAGANNVPRFAKLHGHCDAVPLLEHQTAKILEPWLSLDAIIPSLTIDFALGRRAEGTSGLAEVLIIYGFCETIKALRFLHSCDPVVVHQDIHADNILLELTDDLPRVVLSDFGHSDVTSDEVHVEIEEDLRLLHGMTVELYKSLCKFGVLDEDSDSSLVDGWADFKKSYILNPETPSPGLRNTETTSRYSMTKSAEQLGHSILEKLTHQQKVDIAKYLRQLSEPQEAKLLTQFRRMGFLPG